MSPNLSVRRIGRAARVSRDAPLRPAARCGAPRPPQPRPREAATPRGAPQRKRRHAQARSRNSLGLLICPVRRRTRAQAHISVPRRPITRRKPPYRNRDRSQAERKRQQERKDRKKKNSVSAESLEALAPLLAVAVQGVVDDGIGFRRRLDFIHLHRFAFELFVILKEASQHE